MAAKESSSSELPYSLITPIRGLQTKPYSDNIPYLTLIYHFKKKGGAISNPTPYWDTSLHRVALEFWAYF